MEHVSNGRVWCACGINTARTSGFDSRPAAFPYLPACCGLSSGLRR